jgi:hypothetical protein
MIIEEDQPAGQASVSSATMRRNRYTPSKPPSQPADSPPAGETAEPGLIGPIGYDVLQ